MNKQNLYFVLRHIIWYSLIENQFIKISLNYLFVFIWLTISNDPGVAELVTSDLKEEMKEEIEAVEEQKKRKRRGPLVAA